MFAQAGLEPASPYGVLPLNYSAIVVFMVISQVLRGHAP